HTRQSALHAQEQAHREDYGHRRYGQGRRHGALGAARTRQNQQGPRAGRRHHASTSCKPPSVSTSSAEPKSTPTHSNPMKGSRANTPTTSLITPSRMRAGRSTPTVGPEIPRAAERVFQAALEAARRDVRAKRSDHG